MTLSLRFISAYGLWLLALICMPARAQLAERIVDITTREGVTQRVLVVTPLKPTAVVVLFAGGHGGLRISIDGTLTWGKGNFLVRSRQLFADRQMMVVVIDAPSDRQSEPFLSGFRQTREHAADVRAVLAWVREQVAVPVWLVGTSRGTQSAAYLATELTDRGGPDGVVLTATVLKDERGRPVPDMLLEKIRVPTLVVHHEDDGCRVCRFADIPALTKKLAGNVRTELISFKGGANVGDPCEARAYHGFNGIEREVVSQIVAWIVATPNRSIAR